MPNMTREQYRQRIMSNKLSVRTGMQRIVDNLSSRGTNHDNDKLFEDEFDDFYKGTDEFYNCKFGSPEYDAALEKMQPALRLHYARNDHHPNGLPNGINSMSLMALIEMLVDWKSASAAYGDSSFEESMLINKRRFDIGEQLFNILWNTAKELGYFEG